MPVLSALPAHEVMMGAHPVKQPIPTQSVDQIDPFLLLHHHTSTIPSGTDRWDAGVGPHPHRGFSPITFIWEGGVHHRDSRGNNSVVEAGGVQWMDVGMGIIHSERPPAKLCTKGGVQEIIQIWVNLPSSKKTMEPVYIPFQKEELPAVVGHPDLKIVSGIVHSSQKVGPLKGAYPVNSAHGIATEKPFSFSVKENENGLLYLLNGRGRLEGYGILDHSILYHMSAGEYTAHLEKGTKVFFISAAPILEKVESYGPFVMNNQKEIMEAMRDYQMGKMGYLVERDMP
ncbi:pirin family protein [Schleiferiaceae bacterium]|jgi:quercetin 2,3-dioxygenase|nr:pirin family protein [Schleiferiaceae bacterium]|tara:strand:- start:2953 stop:3810 length:858 start_codon:yes stop_codon:yes gene_type:complete